MPTRTPPGRSPSSRPGRPGRGRGPSRAGGPTRPVARIKGLGDLAATVPYLLGFVPAESLTCVGLTGVRVGITARVDLADVVSDLAGDALLDQVFTAAAHCGAHAVLALVSTAASTVDPVVVERLQRAADRAGVDLRDVGWHRGERCRSLLCTDPDCCPPEGVPVDPACQAAASAAFDGAVALPSREAVEAEFDRPPGVDPTRLIPRIRALEQAAVRGFVDGLDLLDRPDLPDRPDRPAGRSRATIDLRVPDAAAVLDLAARLDAHVERGEPGPPLTDEQVAGCVVALADVAVRDAVWLALEAGTVDGGGLWLDLALRAPSPYDASALFLAAWRAWRRGDGLRAGLAAERADATPGGYSAARLLLGALETGCNPHALPRLA